MQRDHEKNSDNRELRRRAEERLKITDGDIDRMSDVDVKSLVQDLQIYQAELEITIEDLRETQLELSHAHDRYRDLYQSAPVGYLTLDQKGVIKQANATASELLGIEPDKLKNMQFPQLVPRDDRDRCYLYLRKVYKSQLPNSADFRFLKASHQEQTFLRLRTMRIAISEGEEEWGMALVDVTEAKRSVEALKLSEQELRRRTEDLAACNEELESFSFSVAHDLRTPLQITKSFVEILLKECMENFDQECHDYLQLIHSNTQRMGSIIDDLLALTKISRKEMELTDIDLSEMARLSVKEISEINPDRAVDVKIQDGLRVRGDARLMSLVLGNLLDNAWKYTAKEEYAHVEFGAFEKDSETVYYVKDNGTGFDMKYAHKLFAPFKRLHSDKEFYGTGVGLAIVERAIKRHGGRVWAEGARGEGAVFYFTLGDR